MLHSILLSERLPFKYIYSLKKCCVYNIKWCFLLSNLNEQQEAHHEIVPKSYCIVHVITVSFPLPADILVWLRIHIHFVYFVHGWQENNGCSQFDYNTTNRQSLLLLAFMQSVLSKCICFFFVFSSVLSWYLTPFLCCPFTCTHTLSSSLILSYILSSYLLPKMFCYFLHI